MNRGAGAPPGQCRRSWLVAVVGAIAGVFVTPRPVEGAVYHPSHYCPRCGNLVLKVYAMRPAGGHYHRCGTTTTWWH